jgi:hypothetical protein
VLRFLLDEHLSPEIARQIKRRRPDVAIESLPEWRGGAFLGSDDAALLAAAVEEGLSLVTCDQRTIGPLLRVWGETGIPHAGVVFISRGAYGPQDVGGIARALEQLWDDRHVSDWTDVAIYL